MPLTIWCNKQLPGAASEILASGIGDARLVLSGKAQQSNLVEGGPDPDLASADIAFGQPDPAQVVESLSLKWVHLGSAGYTRYDTDAVRKALRNRGGAITNSSSVFDEPCAEHLLAMMLSLARGLPMAWGHQRGQHLWPTHEHRDGTRLLTGQSVIVYGYGAIGRRLIDLLGPLRMDVTAVRRDVRGDEAVRTLRMDDADAALARADHVMDVLPASHSTDGYFDAGRIERMKRGAIFYNIGRGTTVDQPALQQALERGNLRAAYLDVTEPEPLPADHPLWTTRNCYITPHARRRARFGERPAGGAFRA